MLPDAAQIWSEIRALKRELRSLRAKRELLEQHADELRRLADDTETITKHMRDIADGMDGTFGEEHGRDTQEAS